ncbi:hypothetical protein MMC26_001472 [Xylographa opegraphella]|nr:hypothetical protein [Xylographa opegraphella]
MGTVGAIFIVYFVVSSIYNIYLHPLSKYPGPNSTAISRLPLIYSTITGNTWRFTEKLHARYGSIVRIAPDEISTTSSGAWKDIYTTKPLFPKDPFSQTPPMNGAESLFTAAGETHHRIRKNFINAFSDRALKDQSPIIESYANLLMTRLRREIIKSPNADVDMAKFYGYATLDIIADLTFGESFYGLEGDNEHSWILGFFLGAKFGSVRNSLSRYHPIDKIFGWIFLRLTAKNRARSWRVATDKISRRLEMGDLGTSRSDFITPIVGRLDETQQKGITRKELNTNGLAVVIAGCQLTTVALATATYLLMRYPETLKQLTEEIRGSFNLESDITIPSTINLPYLAAVINETLRIHHPTPINLPRVMPPEGQMIDGHWISGGNIIGVNLQNIQNDPANWVEPRVFHPERFLPTSDSRYEKRFDKDDKQAFQPFSVGGRNCMGGKVFLAEARIILAKMVWNFDFEMVDTNDWNWMDQKAYLVFEPKALMVRLKEKA